MEVHFFDETIERFIYSLEKPTVAKVLRTLNLLERFSHELGMPHSKKISLNIFELRIRGIQEIRFLYTFYRQKILILHGFIKKSNKVPTRELQIALKKRSALDRI